MSRVPRRGLEAQRGYLLEMPLLLVALVVGLAILLPMLPPLGRKLALSAAAVPALYVLYYMIVTPGWTPGERPGLGGATRLAVFALVVAAALGALLVLWFG